MNEKIRQLNHAHGNVHLQYCVRRGNGINSLSNMYFENKLTSWTHRVFQILLNVKNVQVKFKQAQRLCWINEVPRAVSSETYMQTHLY